MDFLDTHLDEFQQHLLDGGFAPSAAQNYRFRASTFLKANPDALKAGKDEAKETIESYIAGLPRNTAATIPASATRRWWVFRFDEPYFNRLRPSDCVGDEAIDEECRCFGEYLKAHGNVIDETIKKRVGSIRLFLYAIYPDGSFARGAVTLADIVGYHSKATASDGMTRRNINGTDLRSYAKFLRSVGCDVGPLDSISLSGPTRRDHVVPGLLDEQAFEKLKASCDRGTPRGDRDLAMAMCMGNLGLRACDVARLRLEDVNWMEGTLTVEGSKSKTARTLPLDEGTGRAIERSVLSRKADTGVRALFVNTIGNPIKSHQVQTAMSLAAGRACIDTYHGTHGLRRTVATNMANAGIDVKTIADVLGHERIDTTVRYMRVSMANLRKVAAHWPEGGGDEQA